MRVEILKKGVMEEIYALSALQGYVELPEMERALLQEDQEEGLSVLVGDAFADVVMELMPRVADIGTPEDDSEGNMWIELKEYDLDQKIMAPIMTQMLTKGIAYKVLGAIYEGVEVGAKYYSRARQAVSGVIELIDRSLTTECRLRGWR